MIPFIIAGCAIWLATLCLGAYLHYRHCKARDFANWRAQTERNLATRKELRLKRSRAGRKGWSSSIHNAAVRHGVASINTLTKEIQG